MSIPIKGKQPYSYASNIKGEADKVYVAIQHQYFNIQVGLHTCIAFTISKSQSNTNYWYCSGILIFFPLILLPTESITLEDCFINLSVTVLILRT